MSTHRKRVPKVDEWLERANPFDCSNYNAHGYRGICCDAVPEPLYVFPIPQKGFLIVPFNKIQEPKIALAIRLTSPIQRTVFPLLSAQSIDEVVEQSFKHYSLPAGQSEETNENTPWVMECEQGSYLGVRYFRFDAEGTVLYLFPPIADWQEDILLVLTQPPQHEHQPFMAHVVQVPPNSASYQQEVLEADCLEHLFDRFLQHYRKKEIARFHIHEFRRHIIIALTSLLIVAIQTVVATVIWRLGIPLVNDTSTTFLLWLIVAICSIGGTLIALRPLRFAPCKQQNERPPKKRYQTLLSGIMLLLEGTILVYEVRGNHMPFSIHQFPTWLLGILILMLPFIVGRQLVPTHPLLAYRPLIYTPWRRPSITVPLAKARLIKMLQRLWGYPPTVGMNALPPTTSLLSLDSDYLHTYQVGSSRMASHSCRIRVYHAEWNDLSAPEPPITLILCSIIPPGNIAVHAEQIATAIWHKEGTPRSLIWIEHWWPSYQPAEFCCVQFHCDRRGTLSSAKRFPVKRADLEAMLQGPLEELVDPSKEGKHRSGGTKRA